MRWEILLGIVTMVVLTAVARCCIYCIYNKECKLKEILKCLRIAFLFIISLDYCFAKCAKKKIKSKYEQEPAKEQKTEDKQKKELAQYIKTANHANLIISIILCIITIPLVFFCNCEFIYFFLFGLIGFRLWSRTMEINAAFLKDCVEKDKNSDLGKYERIKLAFFSLIEEAVLFMGIYTFFDKMEWYKPILGGLHSFILSPVSICSAYRFAVFFKFVAVYQIICSVVLITISFATYISKQET